MLKRTSWARKMGGKSGKNISRWIIMQPVGAKCQKQCSRAVNTTNYDLQQEKGEPKKKDSISRMEGITVITNAQGKLGIKYTHCYIQTCTCCRVRKRDCTREKKSYTFKSKSDFISFKIHKEVACLVLLSNVNIIFNELIGLNFKLYFIYIIFSVHPQCMWFALVVFLVRHFGNVRCTGKENLFACRTKKGKQWLENPRANVEAWKTIKKTLRQGRRIRRWKWKQSVSARATLSSRN